MQAALTQGHPAARAGTRLRRITCAILLAVAACGADPARLCDDGVAQTFFCGLNRRGTQTRTCAGGAWSAVGDCSDPDVCVDHTMHSLPCGRNARGSADETCVAGAWEAPSACADPDVCVDGTAIPLACGRNGRGTQTQSCAAGAWTTSSCADPDTCVDGTTDTRACGPPGGFGAQTRSCTTGQWSDHGDCVSPLVIRAPGRRDMVHDARRQRLYITTRGSTGSDGQVLSYDLATGQFDPPLLGGGAFLGIDLSPNGDQLAVADAATDAAHSWIYTIDLPTHTARRVPFNLGFSEAGTFSVVYTSNTEVLVTSSFTGSGNVPLRRVDLATGTTTSVAVPFGVTQDTMLSCSADGSTVGFAESNVTPGRAGWYDVVGHGAITGDIGFTSYEIAVERSGAQFSAPTYSGLLVLDRAFHVLTTIGTPTRALPVGVAYSPVRDELYLAWGGASTSIDAYSTTTLRKLRDIAPLPGTFFWNAPPGNPSFGHAFDNGRLRVSRDGTLIFATAPPATILVYSAGTGGEAR